MHNTILLLLFLLFVNGVSGADTDETKSVMEGDSVTLRTNLTEIQNDDTILWNFGPEGSFISQITKKNNFASLSYGNDVRFKGRSQVDQNTGSLTIRNTRITHSGQYTLTISSKTVTSKIFHVTVQRVASGTDGLKSKTVSVTEGQSVTLDNDKAQIQGDDLVLWRFGDEGVLLAKFDVETKEISLNDADEGFRGRLQLDHQTGSLTITNTRTTDSGLYQLQIRGSESLQQFVLTVSQAGLSPGAKAGIVIVVLLVFAAAAAVIYYRLKMSELKPLSVTEGEDVTLKPDYKINKGDVIQWLFGDKKLLTRPAEIRGETRLTLINDYNADERFKDRLDLDEATGSLTIKNTRTEHSGLYKLHIRTRIRTLQRTFIVTVNEKVEVKSVNEGSVTLNPDTEIQRGDQIQWMFGHEYTVIAQIKAGTGETYDGPDRRFRGRLELNKETGSLTITDFTTKHNGPYKLQIISRSRGTSCKKFRVSKQGAQQTSETAEKQADSILKTFLETHKSNMKKIVERISECKKENEANPKEENYTDLQAVYTDLFITEGDMKEVNQEHEILKIDDEKTQDKPIECNDIFILLRENKSTEKIVLTKGVAGIGKTVSVHKFILDWAEGKANQDIHCVFLLPFQQINCIKDKFNLHEFLLKFYPKLKDLEKSKLYEECKLAFIFDGLDESRLPLKFNKNKIVDDVEERSSVDVLFTNLVEGNLLPSALVWVTSRPAAANQIPPEYVGLFTEVRGFTDQQKEQYFRKKITDKTLADRIISHIKTNRSLYIMCHIPVFCCITATVLQHILKNGEEIISTTLTEMYIHFLLIQMNMKNQKYDEQEERERTELLDSNREMILKLAKLAFEQLKQENIVFYEKDLKSCGIDASKDTEFTGMIAEIFKTEHGLHKTKVFCFVHLSVQEFLAAVHVFICYLNNNIKELRFFFDPEQSITMQRRQFFFEPEQNITLQELLQMAVDKAMESERGHLDLFLRFLMGITLESSQNLLQGLITDTEDTTESIRQTTEHIKQVQNCNIPDEASVNLYYCLLELKDHSLYEEIQRYLSPDEHPGGDLSSSMCTVLTYTLLMSEKVLDEFNPKRFTSSSRGYTRLLPAVRCCRKAL